MCVMQNHFFGHGKDCGQVIHYCTECSQRKCEPTQLMGNFFGTSQIHSYLCSCIPFLPLAREKILHHLCMDIHIGSTLDSHIAAMTPSSPAVQRCTQQSPANCKDSFCQSSSAQHLTNTLCITPLLQTLLFPPTQQCFPSSFGFVAAVFLSGRSEIAQQTLVSHTTR